MAKFDESKVINGLNKGKAEVGKRYWYADYIGILKARVESNNIAHIRELIAIDDDNHCCFVLANSMYELLYPYEEPPKQRMTYRQLAEWMAKGNGEYTESTDKYCRPLFTMSYSEENRDELVSQSIFIRSWDSDEWQEPLYSIYERDCKGGKE